MIRHLLLALGSLAFCATSLHAAPDAKSWCAGFNAAVEASRQNTERVIKRVVPALEKDELGRLIADLLRSVILQPLHGRVILDNHGTVIDCGDAK